MSNLTREEKNIWKEQVITSRFEDFKTLVQWLKSKKVQFKETYSGIEMNIFDVSNTLKVKFPRTRKEYQYNLEGIIERISKDLNLK